MADYGNTTVVIEELLGNLTYYRIEIGFLPTARVRMKYWIGAVLRNRLLHAADQVYDQQGKSLRQLIDSLPLEEEHFLYRQLQGGFPKRFLLDCSSLPYEAPGFCLKPGTPYHFSLLLIGESCSYLNLFVKAVYRMMDEGFGYPMTPMTLLSIKAQKADYTAMPDTGPDNRILKLQFKTPVCLMHASPKGGNGFQNKLNNFPSFYQFMRSLTYRMATLSILYAGNRLWETRTQMDTWIEQYTDKSTEAVLLQANLLYEKRYSTPKKGKDDVYTMDGYTGNLTFGHVSTQYIPLLSFASGLGVGDNVNYGMGCFETDVPM